MAEAPANHRIADRAEVVERAEHLAEVLVREIGQRAAVGRAARRERLRRNEQRRDELLPISMTLMMSAAAAAASCVLRMRACRIAPRDRRRSPSTSGMTATPVSKPERPSASFGNSKSATTTIVSGLPCCGEQPGPPGCDTSRGAATM